MAELNNSLLPQYYRSVDDCPRCKGRHAEVLFKKTQFPTKEFTHWAMCPALQEPIFRKEAVSTNVDDY